MFRDSMLKVAKISNGFVIEVNGRFKIKQSEKEDSDRPICTGERGYSDKEVFAKDATDLGLKIEKLIPLLEEEVFDSEAAFDKAFNEAAKK